MHVAMGREVMRKGKFRRETEQEEQNRALPLLDGPAYEE
jgi:hypothetical protein